MKLAMLACCAVMLVPTVGWFAAGGNVSTLGEGVAAFLPILGCLALHGAMFLVMGKSCHGKETSLDEAAAPLPEAAKIPVIERRPAKAVADAV